MEIDLQSKEYSPNRIDNRSQSGNNLGESDSIRNLIQNAVIDLNDDQKIVDNLHYLCFKKVVGKGPADFFLKVKLQIRNEFCPMRNFMIKILNEGRKKI